MKKPEKEILEAMTKDPGNWKGVLYYNRKDRRILVPKLNPVMGWTLNFASPFAYLSLISIILILIAFEYFLN
jgi:uncharacterized membrane protein